MRRDSLVSRPLSIDAPPGSLALGGSGGASTSWPRQDCSSRCVRNWANQRVFSARSLSPLPPSTPQAISLPSLSRTAAPKSRSDSPNLAWPFG